MVTIYGVQENFVLAETEDFMLRVNAEELYETEEKMTVIYTDKQTSVQKQVVINVEIINEEGIIKLTHQNQKLIDSVKSVLEEHEGMEFE